MVGPKEESDTGRGMRYHAKEEFDGVNQSRWIFEERNIPLFPTNMLLTRILIGKVTDMKRLEKILRDVPIVQANPRWNCVTWVRNSLEALQTDGKALGSCQLDWAVVRDIAMRFTEFKKDQHRFDGLGLSICRRLPRTIYSRENRRLLEA